MGVDASHVDWEAVWMDRAVARKVEDLGRGLTEQEREEVKQETGSDPCDDCCCGGCGGRKSIPGGDCC